MMGPYHLKYVELDEGTGQDLELERHFYFGIVLSTEKQQAFLEVRKAQHSGERTFDYWQSALECEEQM